MAHQSLSQPHRPDRHADHAPASLSQSETKSSAAETVTDNRPGNTAAQALQQMADNSARVHRLTAVQRMANEAAGKKYTAVQKKDAGSAHTAPGAVQHRAQPAAQRRTTQAPAAMIEAGKAMQVENAPAIHTPVPAGTVQRIVLNPTIAPGVKLSIHEQDKWNKVVQDLNAMAALKNYPWLTVNINVIHTGGTNPADTVMNGIHNIDIRIQDWFIDQSSAGETVGLIMHELAAHDLTDEEMGNAEKRQEKADATNAFNFAPGGHNRVLAPTRLPAVGGPLAVPALIPDDRQEDHVNVGRDDGAYTLPMVPDNPIPPGANISVRAAKYTETVLAQGQAIWNRAGGVNAEKIKDMRDLLETYLFDVARIMATDDGGAVTIFRSADVIADVMKWYSNVIIARYHATYAWLNNPALAMNKSAWDIRGMLIGKVGAFIAARIGTSALGRSLPGRMARPLAGAVGNILGGALRGTGQIVSGALRGAGRLIGGNLLGIGQVLTGNVGRGLSTMAGSTVGGIGNILGGAVRGTGSILGGIWGGLKRVGGDAYRGITGR